MSSAARSDSFSPSEKNLTMGDFHVPSSCTRMYASPASPASFARTVHSSTTRIGTPASPLALIALTTFPFSTAPAKTLNALPRKMPLRSVISMPNRRSGLSLPYRLIASA
jgi:hypothetical protein